MAAGISCSSLLVPMGSSISDYLWMDDSGPYGGPLHLELFRSHFVDRSIFDTSAEQYLRISYREHSTSYLPSLLLMCCSAAYSNSWLETIAKQEELGSIHHFSGGCTKGEHASSIIPSHSNLVVTSLRSIESHHFFRSKQTGTNARVDRWRLPTT